MPAEIVQVRIEKDELEFADFLVKAGICKTRSEALRFLISRGIANSDSLRLIKDRAEDLKRTERRKGKIPIDLAGATKRLIEERDRS